MEKSKKITAKRLEKYGFVLDEINSNDTYCYYDLNTKNISYKDYSIHIEFGTESICFNSGVNGYYKYINTMQELKDLVFKRTGKKLKKLPQYKIKNKPTLAANGNIIGPPKKEKKAYETKDIKQLREDFEKFKKSIEKIECLKPKGVDTFGTTKEPFHVVDNKYADAFRALDLLLKFRDKLRNGWTPKENGLEFYLEVFFYQRRRWTKDLTIRKKSQSLFSFSNKQDADKFIKQNLKLLKKIEVLYD